MSETLVFEAADFNDDLPPPGYYPAVVGNARFRRSERGNDTIQVVYQLDGVPPGRDRVTEYFLMRGGSARGRTLSRQRLVELYRCCGVLPKEGEGIDPADLFGVRLEVRIEHDNWQGRPCLRVVGHRAIRGDEQSMAVPF